MRRFIFSYLIICIILALLCCSCGFFGPQEYICEINNVESIKIVKLDQYVNGEYRYEYTVLAEISDHAAFVQRLNNLDHRVNWGDPGRLQTGYVVIRVDYINGDYDLIYPNAQWFNRDGVNDYGFFFFDVDQFDTLISDYTMGQN